MTGRMAKVMLTPRRDRWSCVSMGKGTNFVGGGRASIVSVRPVALNVSSLVDRWRLTRHPGARKMTTGEVLGIKERHRSNNLGRKGMPKRKGHNLKTWGAASAILIAPTAIHIAMGGKSLPGVVTTGDGDSLKLLCMSATRDGASPGAPQRQLGSVQGGSILLPNVAIRLPISMPFDSRI